MTRATCVEAKAIRRELCRNCVPTGKKLESYIAVTLSLSSGTTRNRTGDTRIFSPLLYQLSYGTIRRPGLLTPEATAKVHIISQFPNSNNTFFHFFCPLERCGGGRGPWGRRCEARGCPWGGPREERARNRGASVAGMRNRGGGSMRRGREGAKQRRGIHVGGDEAAGARCPWWGRGARRGHGGRLGRHLCVHSRGISSGFPREFRGILRIFGAGDAFCGRKLMPFEKLLLYLPAEF